MIGLNNLEGSQNAWLAAYLWQSLRPKTMQVFIGLKNNIEWYQKAWLAAIFMPEPGALNTFKS
jgi:hypothetical protein